MARAKTYGAVPLKNAKRNQKPVRKKKKSNFSLFWFLYRIVSISCAAALGLAYLSMFVNPAVMSLPYFFGLYFIPLVIINSLLLLISLIRLRPIMFIPLSALLPALLVANLFFKTGKEENAYGGDEFKFMTYNVGRFSAAEEGMNPEAAMAKIVDFIEREDPDVLCLQEFKIADTTAIRNILKQLPYRHSHFFGNSSIPYFGNITFSKYPILESGKIAFEHSTNLCVWTDIALKENHVRVYNCHLQSTSVSFTSFIERMHGTDADITDEVAAVHRRLKGSNIQRSEQVEVVLSSTRTADHPSIICGDFNDTPISYTYHKLRGGRKDSFVEGGKGFGATYSYLWPLLRIDYMLLPKEFNADRNQIQRVPYSDHYPVRTLIYTN